MFWCFIDYRITFVAIFCIIAIFLTDMKFLTADAMLRTFRLRVYVLRTRRK